MKIANVIAYVLVIVGALNWGLFGLLGFNLVGFVFAGARSLGSVVVYSLVALAGIWLIISPCISGGRLEMSGE